MISSEVTTETSMSIVFALFGLSLIKVLVFYAIDENVFWKYNILLSRL